MSGLSLLGYFPGGEEKGATVVNCIRQEGEAEGKAYPERSLTVGEKALKLHLGCLGVESFTGRGEKSVIRATAQLHLSNREGRDMLVSLAEDTRLLSYEWKDYSGSGYRFRDDPLEEEL